MYRRLILLTVVGATGLIGPLATGPANAARFCVTHDTGPSRLPRVSGFTCVDTTDPNLLACEGSINGNTVYICT